MNVFIDGKDIDSKESLHGEFIEKLELPLYYGRNLDALHDCLTEISAETAIYFYNMSAAKEKLGAYAKNLVRVLEDSASENQKLEIHIFSGEIEYIK